MDLASNLKFKSQRCSPLTPAKIETRTFKIRNMKGLHARASAKFVKCAESFNAQITVSKDGNTVGATSIMGLMMLGAAPGSEILVQGSGPEIIHALDALDALVVSSFGEIENS